MPASEMSVIPAQAGIQFVGLIALKINPMNYLDSRRSLPAKAIGGGNDGAVFRQFQFIHNL